MMLKTHTHTYLMFLVLYTVDREMILTKSFCSFPRLKNLTRKKYFTWLVTCYKHFAHDPNQEYFKPQRFYTQHIFNKKISRSTVTSFVYVKNHAQRVRQRFEMLTFASAGLNTFQGIGGWGHGFGTRDSIYHHLRADIVIEDQPSDGQACSRRCVH